MLNIYRPVSTDNRAKVALTQNDFWSAVKPGLDVGVNSLVFVTA